MTKINYKRLGSEEEFALKDRAEKAERERDEAKQSFADYIERLDLVLDEAKVPCRDGVGRCGPFTRVQWLLQRWADEKAENARLREAIEAYKTVLHYRPNPREWWDGEMAPEKELEYNKAVQFVNNFQISKQALKEGGKG